MQHKATLLIISTLLLLCCSVFADDSCDSPTTVFTGTLDPTTLTTFQVNYPESWVIEANLNPTPSASGKIEITVTSCTPVDKSELLADLENGGESAYFTLQANNDGNTPAKTSTSPAARLTSAQLPLITLALSALFFFPKNRLSLIVLFGVLCFAAYTQAATQLHLKVDVSLPAGVTRICWNNDCKDITVGPTSAPTAAPTDAPTVAPTAAPTAAPTPVPIPTDIAMAFNLRVLVIADKLIDLSKMDWGDGEEIPNTYGADFVNTTFMSVGMPYDFVPTTTDLTTYLSTTGTVGQYSGIVYCKQPADVIPDAQQALITAYQLKYGVKYAIVGSTPAQTAGMVASGTKAVSEAGVVYVPSGVDPKYTKTMVVGAQADVTYVDNWQTSKHSIQPGTISDSSVATPVIMFKPTTGSELVAAAIVKVSGVEQLHYFMQQSTANFHSFAMAPLLLNFISPGGVFQGARRITLSVQPDDLFLSGFMWDVANHQDSTTEAKPIEYRITGTDLRAAADWLDAKNAELGSTSYISIEWPFNGQGSNAGSLPDPTAVFDSRFIGTDLYNVTMELYEKFWFISHTWDHPCPNFDTESVDYISKELSYNNIWASTNFLPGGLDNPRMSKECMVSPCITGLHNPNLWQAMANNGIKYQVGDNSEAYKSSPRSNPYRGNWTTMADNGFVGGFIIPREVYSIDVGNSLPEEFTDQWNTENPDAAGTFEEDLLYPVTQGLFNLIAYRQDPHMFHEASVRAFSYDDPKKGTITVSLVTLWMDRVIDGVRAFFDLPVKSPKYSDLADIWTNRMAMDDCGVSTEVLVDSTNKVVGLQVVSQQTCVVQYTGISLAETDTVKMETYGADTTAYVTLTAGVSQAIYFTPVAL